MSPHLKQYRFLSLLFNFLFDFLWKINTWNPIFFFFFTQYIWIFCLGFSVWCKLIVTEAFLRFKLLFRTTNLQCKMMQLNVVFYIYFSCQIFAWTWERSELLLCRSRHVSLTLKILNSPPVSFQLPFFPQLNHRKTQSLYIFYKN